MLYLRRDREGVGWVGCFGWLVGGWAGGRDGGGEGRGEKRDCFTTGIGFRV
jgi:hypothetical protein